MPRDAKSHLTASPSQYRSIPDVARTCAVTTRSARRWVERGLVPVKVTVGGHPRIGCDDDGWPIALELGAGDEQ